MADFPDATNTGVTSGATLTKYNGTLHITEDNAVISNMDITGDIVIDAKNVTLSNIKLTSSGAWTAIRVMDDASGFTLQNSEIDGKGLSQNGIYGHGTFIGNDIYGVENGITVAGPSDIRDNYIHNFLGTAEAHYDGIEVNGGHDIDIVHNTVVVDHGQTSAVMLDNWAGGLSNITVENNRLAGGGYTVYLDDTFGGGAVDDGSIQIINNQVGDGQWGDFSLYGNNPVMYGNTDLNTLPADTTPTDPAPVDTTTADAAPADTTTTDAAPAGTTTTDTTATDAAPADTTPTDTTTADTTATDAAPADTTATDITSPTAPTHTAQTDTPPGTSSTGTAVESPTTDSEADTGLDGPLEGTSGDTDSVANAANNGDAKGTVHNWIKQTFGSNFADKFHANTHTHSSLALGADDLMGGSDADTFVFKTAGESTSALTGPDSIFDFSGTGGDRIDVADIDANSAASGDQAFTYLGTAAFTGKAGELRDAKQASDTYVYGDTNGDRNADCAVHLDDAVSLSKGDFVL
ncbi:hypothetical protein [Rhizobium giardinii]|uniref:Right handed beta helix domain-containing protein n=1 Tax=Rhizobium giardinii TaxID=56731 RepID=A0A7W8UD27_9HYPH|nr:hypothetical protein [Rhizobium giardinii]